MIADEVKIKVESICDEVVTIAEQEAVKLIVNKNRTPREAFKSSGCYYHHKRDRKKYRQVQMRAKRQHDKKRVQRMTKQLRVRTLKDESIQDHRRAVHRAETELRQSLHKQKEMEKEMKRLRFKCVVVASPSLFTN